MRQRYIAAVVAIFLLLSFAVAWAQETKQQPLQAPQLKQAEQKQASAARPRRDVPHPNVGDTIADFALKDLKGKDVRLSDFKGKILVLELGACT